jgi:hypothetical protein
MASPNKPLPDTPAALTYRGKFVVRSLGAIFLAVDLAMFVAGQTLWREELAGPMFLLYWSWCFLLTLLAGLVAVVDLFFVQRAGRQSRRALLQHAITERK